MPTSSSPLHTELARLHGLCDATGESEFCVLISRLQRCLEQGESMTAYDVSVAALIRMLSDRSPDALPWAQSLVSRYPDSVSVVRELLGCFAVDQGTAETILH